MLGETVQPVVSYYPSSVLLADLKAMCLFRLGICRILALFLITASLLNVSNDCKLC